MKSLMLHFDIDLSEETFGIRPSLMLGKEFKDRVNGMLATLALNSDISDWRPGKWHEC